MLPENSDTTRWSLVRLQHVSPVFLTQTWKMRNFLKPQRKLRSRSSNCVSTREIADNDQVAALITDAYATVAVAYRRASAAYAIDEEMQKLGTAAVHLLTIAMSYMAAQTDEAAQK